MEAVFSSRRHQKYGAGKGGAAYLWRREGRM
jgi:hypothetical protein